MTFVLALCAPGAERALKDEVAARRLPWAPGYQRPGFVTFRADDATTAPEDALPALTWARERSVSLGKIAGPDAVSGPCVRVSARDPMVALSSGPPPFAGQRVIEVVKVTPDEWWAGAFVHDATHALHPGGIFPAELPPEAPSRAYLKLEAVLEWWGAAVEPGDVVIELGSAPGGASWSLLRRGAQVFGVDPGQMDPRVLAHPSFRWVEGSINVLPARALPDRADWIVSDMNVTPRLTLKTARALVERTGARGAILTLKLGTYELARHVPAWIEEVRRWGAFDDVRAQQLSPHKVELALVARATSR